MIRHDDMTIGDTLILWNGHRVTCAGKPYVEDSGFIPRTMVVIRFEGQAGMMEMSVNVDSVVSIEGKAVQMSMFELLD